MAPDGVPTLVDDIRKRVIVHWSMRRRGSRADPSRLDARALRLLRRRATR
jgi:hypothetical protein